jgi:predicted amidohydrolase
MKIAVLQITSKLDPAENLKKIRELLKEASEAKATAAFLPECFYSLTDGKKVTPFLVEKGNEHYQNIKKLAQDFSINLIGGSASTLLEGRVVNRAYNFDSKGNELSHYDKVHLFACDLKDKKVREADTFTAGSKYQTIRLEKCKIGLGICFDLRFPDQFSQYRKEKCDLVTVASAFTVPTGKAHWHTLLRARAIENQYYVVASAQWGKHNDRVETYGHSLVVDPWGNILVDAGDGEGVFFADINFDLIGETRAKVILD